MNDRMKIARVAVVGGVLAAMAGGCSQTGYTQPGRSVVSAEQITATEWQGLANDMTASLQRSGVLNRYAPGNGQPVVISIADFYNDSYRAEFRRTKDVMYNTLRGALVNTGMASVNVDISGDGARGNGMIGDVREGLAQSGDYDPSTTPTRGTLQAPKLLLVGQINEIRTQAGSTTQYDYVVTLRLDEIATGLERWSDTFVMSKYFKRGFFGG